MPIKFKNTSATTSSDPLQQHLNTFLSPFKGKTEYAEKKLKIACATAELIKKNSDTPEKAAKDSDPLKTAEAKDKLTGLSAVIDKTAQVNQENQQTIIEYLSKQANLRKENQLVYGKSQRDSNLSCLSLGLGLVENQDESKDPIYKRKLISTHTYIYRSDHYATQGAAEFGITYDNKIFILPKPEGSVVNNLYKMAQGTLLKAVGCIQIGNRQLEESVIGEDTYPPVLEGQVSYISVYNAFFDAPTDNIAVSLFALQRLGIDLSDSQVVISNDNAPLISHISGCHINIRGEIKNVSYYLNETRFPGAKALAEKNLTFFDKIDELFCSIDDQILVKCNKRLIKEIYGEKELLKLNLIKLFNCTEELIKDIEKKAKIIKTESGLQKAINQPTTSSQTIVDQTIESKTDSVEEKTGAFNDYWQAIRNNIQFFKEKNSDLSFLVPEINTIVAYIIQNSLTPEGKDQLKELTTTPARIPGRGLDLENIPDYIKFYERDPIQTCRALLKDYSKGNGWQGIIHRFFSGAWNRNYKGPVNKVLSAYHKNELPDNLTICDIYEKLKDSGLMFNFDAESKSSLRKILLFCAKLNNEEEALLHLILHSSITLFPPLDQDRTRRLC